MKKLTVLLTLLCCIGLFASCGGSNEQRSHVLKIYNWADYIDEDVLAEFPAWYKQQTGEDIRIIYQVFDINEIMLTKIERGHEDFDVVCPSEYIIERMLKKDLLLPINRNFGKTPDYIPNISPYIQKELNKTSQPERTTTDYAVPYMWGTAGILYNKNFITEEEAGSWYCLWNVKNKGKILMKDSYRDAYGTAIIYAHAKELADSTVTVEQLMNDNSSEAIELAEKYLKSMKPNISGWEADFGKEMMTKNKTWLNLTWSGDAVWAIDEANAVGVELDYKVPREGSNIWYDGWVIPKYSRNVKAASYFINYLCQPEIAMRNMDAIGYVSAVATPEIMEAKIDTTIEERSDLSYFFGEIKGADSLQINPVQYPDRKIVERCAMIRDFGDRTELVLEMWSRVKGDNLNTGIVLLIFAVFGILFIWLMYGKIRKYKQQQRHHRRRKKRNLKS
ncbi:ABC transporter substrate-binding protein [Bacteroides cutis]|mgnify:FL=1|jgi:spermidine/putrescine transport system substrate-binding protein|uniref:ABC transporter substrate-binding protein n=1 Tax=Bacteroides cutis TaxID=2024197 RepID=UPI0023A8BBAC|nr:ABC transporter substrate-binding protein [Bacteroides cutis]